MGFGITGFVNKATRKALIRWYEPEDLELLQKVYDNTNKEEVARPKGWWTSALDMATMAVVGNLLANEIVPDVRKSEVHKYKSDVTEYALENGAIVAQHIIQNPVEVTLSFEQTNSGKMIRNMLSTFGVINSSEMFDQLVDIWKRKIPVSIITEQQEYKNMVVKNMPIVQQQPYKGALKIMVDFIQLTEASTYLVSYKGKTTNLEKSAQKTVEGGQQQLMDVSANADVASKLGI